MRLAIRNKTTNELTAIVIDHIKEGLNDKQVQELIRSLPTLDSYTLAKIEELGQYISYEEDTPCNL